MTEDWIEITKTVAEKHGFEIEWIPNDPRRKGMSIIEIYTIRSVVSEIFGLVNMRLAPCHISHGTYEYMSTHGDYEEWLDLWLGAINYQKQLMENM